MKRRAPRRRYYPQRRRRPTGARASRRTIRKKKKPSRRSAGESSLKPKPTYFSLLADVEHGLKVEHTEGCSLLKLKRDMEQKYGVRKFDIASNKMFNSAVKRLRNRGRIAKIHPNSSLFKFKPPVVPNYNFFGPGSAAAAAASRSPFGLPAPPLSTKPATGKRSMSSISSKSITMSRSGSGSGSRSRSISRSIPGSISRSTRGSRSMSMSRSPISVRKPARSTALHLRKPMSSVKRSRPAIRRRRY